MNIHFIAIGGAVMHNLALALHKKGYTVTGSDDEIFEPALSRLKKQGLLSEKTGWDASKIHDKLDAIILGMHAREDNPELQKARTLKLPIFSFPEFLYEQTKNKKRVVIAGSHGKTTITSMVMHVLQKQEMKFDYMVGSLLAGFETMVGLDDESEIAVFEGDEYLSSPLDLRPKFLHYKADIALISGIAWDHVNVFPKYETYLDQFVQLTNSMQQDGILIYNENDLEAQSIANQAPPGIRRVAYTLPDYSIQQGKIVLVHEGQKYTMKIFGKFNMENLSGAMKICDLLGIGKPEFLEAMTSFTGAAKRQELLASNEQIKVYLDFAHAPSKVRATMAGFRELYPEKKILACLELHTFSSLNKAFIPEYKDSLKAADKAVVFYNPEVVKHKNLEPVSSAFIKESFNDPGLLVFDDRDKLEGFLLDNRSNEDIVVFMSSGNFSGSNLREIAGRIVSG